MIERIEPGWTHVRDALSKRERHVRRRPGRRRDASPQEGEQGPTVGPETAEPVQVRAGAPAVVAGPTLDLVA
ncbi:MAG: hypothetical protein AB1505_09240 [Candidatus Latescibacterota bacterium]